MVKYKNDVRKTWSVIKEGNGKEKIQQKFPQKICLGSTKIKNLKSITEHVNKFFTDIDANLAKDNTFSVTFENYFKTLRTKEPERNLITKELKNTLFSLKINKSPDYNEINFNVIKKCFVFLHKPILHILNQSLPNKIFPDKLKIARVMPLFKKGSDLDLGNYWPISVLACLSKVLEKIMYSDLYKHF